MTSEDKELHFNDPELSDKIDTVFRPGTGIDIVFDINSETPVVRSSVVYEADPARREVLVAQTDPPTMKSAKHESIDLTSLVKKPGVPPVRAALRCRVERLVKDYQLSAGNKTDAILFRHARAMRKVNVRTSFRVELGPDFEAKVDLSVGGTTFKSGREFMVRDMSVSGMGLVVPRKLKEGRNPLFTVPFDKPAEVSMVLRDLTEKNPETNRIKAKASMIRRNEFHSERTGLLAVRFSGLSSVDENLLSMFVQKAQIEQIRKMNALEL